MIKFLREPLLHFMLIGAGLFGLYTWVNPEEVASEETIVVSEGRIEQFVSVYEKTWHRPPSKQELDGLIEDYVLEEIYYRQAVAIGIDQDDTVIRRRMRQKLEFLTDEVLLAGEVTDADLEKFLSEHSEKFRKDGVYSFEQIYINPQKHGDELSTHLSAIEAKLAAGEAVHSDSYFIDRNQRNVQAWKVNRDFGVEFSDKLDGLELGKWSASIDSGIGLHFVKVSARKEGQLPVLDSIRDAVKDEYLHVRKLESRRVLNEKFLEKYEVVIEWPSENPDA